MTSTASFPSISRRGFIVGGLFASVASPFVLSGCSTVAGASGTASATGELNWLTWGDHYSTEQLQSVASSTDITGLPKLFSDNADAFLQLQQTGGQFDMVSADALWVKKYFEEGLIDAFDLSEIATSSQLFSIAREFDFLNDSTGTLGYPFSWSTVQMYYNPDLVQTPPTSWADLADPKFKGLVVAENNPTDLMAIAALATGAADPYGMDDEAIASASAYLADLKPNLVKLVSQNNEVISMLASGEAAIGISNLGTDIRVKAAGGSQMEMVYPSDGTIGFIDAEMITTDGSNKALVMPFLSAMETSDFMFENFTTNWRPLFNEKAATALLADSKTAEDAKRLYADQPEKALQMTLKAPAQDAQAYAEAFNKIFGA